MSTDALLADYRARADAALDERLPTAEGRLAQLHAAMRYASTQGGKRFRPGLVYATGDALGADRGALDVAATAVELIHAYSLVHDDLPAMDDDELRRGQPTCHIAFDEATAILAGDALQALAFDILATDPALHGRDALRVALIRLLADASGHDGMVYGQAIDLDAVERRLDLMQLRTMHRFKTGAIIRAAVLMGASVGEADAKLTVELGRYADAVGLGFQIADDILDVTADTATLGKPQGSDAASDKPTYVSLLGLGGARREADDCLQAALTALAPLGERAEPLAAIARFAIDRHH